MSARHAQIPCLDIASEPRLASFRRRLSTPALLLAVAVASGCAGSPEPVEAEPTQGGLVSTTTPATVAAPAPKSVPSADSSAEVAAPLTGLVTSSALERPALVVKIDNHDRARPQFGINAADLVFEEIVEGGLTRLAAVFHSGGADPVGPVRSVRTSDFAILSNLNRPLFANSGGNDSVLSLLTAVDIVDVSSNASGDTYYRSDERPAPHNLVSNTEDLWAAGAQRGSGGVPLALFNYRTADARASAGEPTDGIGIEYGATSVRYEWDVTRSGWLRTQNGSPHVDASGEPVAPENVVVQFVAYGRSAADGRSPEAQMVGEGPAWLLTGERLVKGTWRREVLGDITEFLDDSGAPMLLMPGSTWIALARVGQVTELE